MDASKPLDRDWIVAQFSRGIDAERMLAADAEATAKSPPDASLAVLYHQIAREDTRHVDVVARIASRYGHEAVEHKAGVLGGTFGRLKDAVAELGASAQQRLEHDLAAKSTSIHWSTAWVYAFDQVGDSESSRELAEVLSDEKAHHDALQQGLNLLLARGARGETV